MLKKDIAAALGISGAMVSKLVKRGMPTDSVERARRWRKRHLDPGFVKGVRMGTTAPPEVVVAPPSVVAQPRPPALAWPANWANVTAPKVASVEVVEAMGRACGEMLAVDAHLDQVGYPLAFLRDLMRRLDPDQGLQVRFPLGVWLALTSYFIHPEAAIHNAHDHDTVLTAEGFGERVSPGRAYPHEFLQAVWDEDGFSVFGWPDNGEDDEE